MYSSNADQIINIIKETLEALNVKEKTIISAELFMNADNPFSLTKTDELESKEKEFIKQRFISKDSVLVEKKVERRHLSYQYFYMDSKNSELYKGSVGRIVSDRTAEIKDEYFRLLTFVLVLS